MRLVRVHWSEAFKLVRDRDERLGLSGSQERWKQARNKRGGTGSPKSHMKKKNGSVLVTFMLKNVYPKTVHHLQSILEICSPYYCTFGDILDLFH